jgi:phosphopantothenoylcysteine decarboxylase/phosphopantothenate--cysteine ligase
MLKRKNQKNIVLGVTGSIAAYKACDIVRSLQKKECAVTVVMTKEAQKFLTPLTLASLSGQRVYTEMFWDDQSIWEKEHIALAHKADVLLIAPATAHMIGKIACGLADDLLSTIAMTTKAPMVIAPAMNSGMYQNPVVRLNIEKLKKHHVKIVDPIKGSLACGTKGIGHLAEIETIVKKVCALLKNK